MVQTDFKGFSLKDRKMRAISEGRIPDDLNKYIITVIDTSVGIVCHAVSGPSHYVTLNLTIVGDH